MTDCCGEERKVSLSSISHKGDVCLKFCRPGTDLTNSTSVNVSNLLAGTTKVIDIVTQRKCSNSVATMKIDLSISVDLAGV